MNIEKENPEESIPTQQKVEKPKKVRGFWEDTFRFTFIALLIVVPFRIFIAQPFLVSGASMDPTFEDGDYLIVDQISYVFEKPARGSVVIFKYPLNPSKYFIKRIIGLPGETVKITGGKVFIYNSEHPEGFELDQNYVVHEKNESFTTKVEPDSFFVMGDNRNGSLDSRSWGDLPKNLIIGRPIARLFPIRDIALFPGNHFYTQ